MTKLSKTITLNELNWIEFEASCPRCGSDTTVGVIGHHSCNNCGLVVEYTANTYFPSDLAETNEHRESRGLEPLTEIPSDWRYYDACGINEFSLGLDFRLKDEVSLPFVWKAEPR
ncbi:hypothetical protein N9X88_05385 [Alphaproteobacteria bacterium]|nr:hypothetical protein [Alphaproteobacteria bacterium]